MTAPISPRPQISVCILAGHGAARLEECLRGLAAQDSAPEFELLLAGALTAEIIALVAKHLPAARLFEGVTGLPGAARNPLIQSARGELLLFLDDDVVPPPELLANLARVARQYPFVSVFGGPNETPPGSPQFEIVQGAVMSSLIGAGPVSRRYGARTPSFADERWFTLCNLAIRRVSMLPFLTTLVCAEENEVLAELRAQNEVMRYDPCLSVLHNRRRTLTSFARQMFKYGRGRGQLLARAPETFRFAFVVPAGLVAYLGTVAVLLASGLASELALAPVALYAVLVATNAATVSWTLRSVAAMPTAGLLTVVVHLSYGAGLIRGWLRPGHEPGRTPLGDPRLSRRATDGGPVDEPGPAASGHATIIGSRAAASPDRH
jgi:hypothetical protein